MNLDLDECGDVGETVKRIRSRISAGHSVKRIVAGCRRGPMPIAGLLLKMVLPTVRIEVRNHHKTHPVNGSPLELAKVMRR
jgi:hypothetical protein